MARFTTDKANYLNKTAKIGMEDKFSSYNKFLEQAPIFITYYKQNIVETTTDIGMGNTNEMIGDESSISYNRIQHIPLYGVDTAVFDLDYDDVMGLTGSSESSGILLPNTIEPIPNDYFTVDYMNHKYIYKIMGIETEDHIKSNNYFKINFKYDGKNDGAIDKQVEGAYTCLYDNIGTEDVCILRDDVLELCVSVEDRLIAYQDLYLKSFLFNTTNSIILPMKGISGDTFLYDPYLTEFIYRNKVFIRKRSFTTNNIMNVINTGDDFNELYMSSIYRIIEKRNIREFSGMSRYLKMSGHSNYFELCGDAYYKVDIQSMEDVGVNDYIFDKKYSELIDYNYLIAEPYEIDTNINIIQSVVGIIKDYMVNEISNEDLLKKFISIEDVYIRKNTNNFIYFPILFYIIQKSMDNIILKK